MTTWNLECFWDGLGRVDADFLISFVLVFLRSGCFGVRPIKVELWCCELMRRKRVRSKTGVWVRTKCILLRIKVSGVAGWGGVGFLACHLKGEELDDCFGGVFRGVLLETFRILNRLLTTAVPLGRRSILCLDCFLVVVEVEAVFGVFL